MTLIKEYVINILFISLLSLQSNITKFPSIGYRIIPLSISNKELSDIV